MSGGPLGGGVGGAGWWTGGSRLPFHGSIRIAAQALLLDVVLPRPTLKELVINIPLGKLMYFITLSIISGSVFLYLYLFDIG
jgi:hypothetical protein